MQLPTGYCTFAGIVALTALAVDDLEGADLKSGAAVAVTFDSADAKEGTVAVAVGEKRLPGRLAGGAQRTPSPFWGQDGKQALVLDASKRQLVQLEEVPYLDRPEAVTLSFFFLNLHGPEDEAFHGIVAKRSARTNVTNYGLNYHMKNDALQLYVNDGSGYRVAAYSARGVLGTRRMVHLAASFEVADAPAPDEDTNRDDVRVRLFLNGEPVKPTKVDKGLSSGSEAWLTDVEVPRLLNDAPVTLGASTPDTEHTSGLFDEFLLFRRALAASEVKTLFQELAGPGAEELARQELRPNRAEPRISALSLQGLQIEKTTRLTVSGSNLGPRPRVQIPIAGLSQSIVEGTNSRRTIVDLTVPDDAAAGYYPLRVQTENGLSNMLVVAVDRLPQKGVSSTSPQQPAELPAAFSGMLSGPQRAAVYFRGEAGQPIVAEVEARRLGARMDPVVEIKSSRGTPLAIEWSKVALRGDTRAQVNLPADGLYYAELHDLAYKAPGRNPFRLILGDVKVVDAWYPLAAASGTAASLQPVGSGFQPGESLTLPPSGAMSGMFEQPQLPPELRVATPAPPLLISDAVEILESTDDLPQAVHARFTENKHVPVVINGRIEQTGQRDRYLLDVTPGMTLNFRADARAINSPLDARVSVLVDGKVRVAKEDRAGSRDPAFNFAIPEQVERVEVVVGDLHERGGPHFLYRLRLVPAGQPDFRLTLQRQQVNLPQQGTAVVPLQVNRGGYKGPINLSVLGDDAVSITPAQVPAGSGDRRMLVTLRRQGNSGSGQLEHLRIVGESVGLKVPIRRVAVIASESGQPVVPGYEALLPAAVMAPAGFSVSVNQTPEALLKALTAEIGVELTRSRRAAGRPIRLSLVTTEKPRPVDPKNPGKGNKPLVRALPNQVLPAGENAGTLRVAVPADVAAGAIELVVRAELLPHPYSDRVIGVAYSDPVRLPVESAVSVTLDEKAINLVGQTENKIKGAIKRAASFKGDVVIAVGGLPNSYKTSEVTVPAGQDRFELTVTAPKENETRPLNRVTLSVTDKNGRALQPARNLSVKVSPQKN